MAAASMSVFSIFLMWSWSIDAAPEVKIDADKLFEFACTVTEYDCSGLEKPEVVYAPLFSNYGALGVFTTEEPGRVYVDSEMGPYLDKVYLEGVVAHEYTHYIEYSLGIEKMDSKESACRTEWSGWRVMNAYVIVNGRPDLADFTWNERYGCYNWE